MSFFILQTFWYSVQLSALMNNEIFCHYDTARVLPSAKP